MVGTHRDDNYRDILKGIKIKTLVYGSDTLMSEFLLQKNSVLPAHSHPYEQTGYLVKGRIILHIGTKKYEMTPGGSWCIPKDAEHKAEILEDSVALEIFSPAREDYKAHLDKDSLLGPE